jgi:hypothetical protein
MDDDFIIFKKGYRQTHRKSSVDHLAFHHNSGCHIETGLNVPLKFRKIRFPITFKLKWIDVFSILKKGGRSKTVQAKKRIENGTEEH